ncbi:ComEA family DNA-binding protein [Kutzneria albida]|uniref:Helix-hairpin-helix DNA-binding motif class 1 domain-containing protein n=1 Tax=Kutzneria albida DSM 43870 TaxID=1449976 RepID=W5W2A9_9PSEU|nr:ComEA family DNA-binding protein [Kutzneria albida]AHH95002.1 hypothetical protein KALB_1630 [Kutzneria albida DSM 43870]
MLSRLRSPDETDQVRQRLAELAGVQLPPPPSGGLIERWLPGGARAGRRTHALIAIAVLAALLTAAVLWWPRPAPERPPAPAVPAAAAPSASMVVSVVGKVARPGLVTLPEGARVADALRAAGGPLPDADLGTLNLARKLGDGEQLPVGLPAADPAAQAPTKIDINTATEAQLVQLPGVGPATAQRIVQWRSKHGRFQRIEQLREISGIGDAKFAGLKDLVHA